MSMELVQNMQDMKKNFNKLDEYLRLKTDPNYTFVIKLVKKGTCFLAIKSNNGYRFYPSRFIGYKDNTMDRHQNNEEKDGRVTSKKISDILGKKQEICNELNKEYEKYCETLGFAASEKGAFGVERKFWLVN